MKNPYRCPLAQFQSIISSLADLISSFVHTCSVVSDSLQPHGLQPTRLICPWDFPGKNTGVGCHFLLQGIFPTQEWNAHHFCILYLVQPGKPHYQLLLHIYKMADLHLTYFVFSLSLLLKWDLEITGLNAFHFLLFFKVV